MRPLRLWQRLWLLFALIWVVVATIQVVSILAFSEEAEKALQPVVLGILVPAVFYGAGWLWEKWATWRGLPPPES